MTVGFNNRPFRHTHARSRENINSPTGSCTEIATLIVEGNTETPTPEIEKATPHQPFFASQEEVPSYRLLCECPFFPADFPDRFDSITLTDALFVHLNGTYTLRRDGPQARWADADAHAAQELPGGHQAHHLQHSYALMPVDWRVFCTSKSDAETLLKRVCEIENVSG